MVNELINEDMMCRNIEKMDENFKPIDAAVICTIPMVDSLKMIGPSSTIKGVISHGDGDRADCTMGFFR
jgi:hypothetical protein